MLDLSSLFAYDTTTLDKIKEGIVGLHQNQLSFMELRFTRQPKKTDVNYKASTRTIRLKQEVTELPFGIVSVETLQHTVDQGFMVVDEFSFSGEMKSDTWIPQLEKTLAWAWEFESNTTIITRNRHHSTVSRNH